MVAKETRHSSRSIRALDMLQGFSGGFCWLLPKLLFRVDTARGSPFGGSITPPDWLDVDVWPSMSGTATTIMRQIQTTLRKSIRHLV